MFLTRLLTTLAHLYKILGWLKMCNPHSPMHVVLPHSASLLGHFNLESDWTTVHGVPRWLLVYSTFLPRLRPYSVKGASALSFLGHVDAEQAHYSHAFKD